MRCAEQLRSTSAGARTPDAVSGVRRSTRAGLTLVEVLVALAISGVLLLGARALLDQMGEIGHHITAAAARADREANADRLLRSLLGRLEVGTDSTRIFAGDEQRAQFPTWCDVPAGWQERCTATVAIETAGDASVLQATLSTGETVIIRAGFARGELRYLTDAAAGGTWFRRWGKAVTPPLALGFVLDRDTLIVRIGVRG